ncbi:MAG: hypothetical protein ABIV63_01190 [Caldimonas sp.]
MDSRSAAQRAEARRLAGEERHRAAEMETNRLRREASIKPALATRLSAAPAPVLAASAPKTKPKGSKKNPKPRTVAHETVFVVPTPGLGQKGVQR